MDQWRHSLREAWTSIVQANDYDGHMAEIGQAEANAFLVRDLLSLTPTAGNNRTIFAGAGTGQMFDYIDAEAFKGRNILFTDINSEFLSRLSERAGRVGLQRYKTTLDDIEDPRISGPFEIAVLVLVLEHVRWKTALKGLAALDVSTFIIIIQKNPAGMKSAVAPNRVLRPSIKLASEGEPAHLVDEGELEQCMRELGYEIAHRANRSVADEKLMCGFIFSRS